MKISFTLFVFAARQKLMKMQLCAHATKKLATIIQCIASFPEAFEFSELRAVDIT